MSTPLCCLTNIKFMHLENNQIESISDAIGCMSRLKGLWSWFKNISIGFTALFLLKSLLILYLLYINKIKLNH